jgi:hypothetical protein
MLSQGYSYLGDLGQAVFRSVNAKIICDNQFLIPDKITPKEVSKRTYQLIFQKNIWAPNAFCLNYFVQCGGEMVQKKITMDEIDIALSSGHIIIISVMSGKLWEDSNTFGHFVVIFDKDGKSFHISDPHPKAPRNDKKILVKEKKHVVDCINNWDSQILILGKKL